MKAAIFEAVDQPLVVEDVDLRPPGPTDVVVEVEASGVCHSDLSMAKGWVPIPTPSILGHEGAGRVVEVGAEVRAVKPGDRVIASFIPACGVCWYCVRGLTQHCERNNDAKPPRMDRADGTPMTTTSGLGTFAELMVVDQAAVVKVETDLPSDQLALIGCGIMTGVGAALNTAQVVPGSTVAVFGCGGVGQSVIQGARIAGASRIIAVDPVALKRDTALRLGATDVVDPDEGDPSRAVRALCGGRGADYAFEVIGLPETMVQAWRATRPGGTAVMVGMPRSDAQVTFPAFLMFASERRILGSLYGSAQVRRDFPRMVQLAETGRLDLASMVSRHIDLHGVNDAFRAMEAGETIRSVIV